MLDLWINSVLSGPSEGAEPEKDRQSTIRQGRIALMPHIKFDSNRMDSSREEKVLVSYAKIGGRPLSPPYRGPIAMPSTT